MTTYHIVHRNNGQCAAYAAVERFLKAIYLDMYGYWGINDADVFAVALRNGSIVGAMGLVCAHRETYLFESCDPHHPFERLAGSDVTRSACAEISRFAIARHIDRSEIYDITTALTARLLKYAHARGIRHIGFVGKRSFCRIPKRLGLTPVTLGTFDISTHPERDRFCEYMCTPRVCVGFTLPDLFEINGLCACFKKSHTVV